jgi:hypothetical protein
MTPARFHLKHPHGWFAAGAEVHQALTLLSDASFKLFLWLCLHAERSTGRLCCSPFQLAAAVGKTEAEVRVALEELFGKGVAEWIAQGVIEIRDRFWPYERAGRGAVASDRDSYVAEVRRLFLERACVRSVFSAADERLAAQLHQKGTPLECVERAILLGSMRKYGAMLNRGVGTPVTSLHYFATLLDEVQQTQVGSDYWRYVASKVQPLERQWRQAQQTQADETTETK